MRNRSDPADSHFETLRGLEQAMWRTETRGDRAWMDRRLAPGFSAFGVSGRRYSRYDILGLDVGQIDAILRGLQFRGLAEDVVLVTYRSDVAGEPARRSSIWRLTDAGWQMEFHQWTPARAAPDGSAIGKTPSS